MPSASLYSKIFYRPIEAVKSIAEKPTWLGVALIVAFCWIAIELLTSLAYTERFDPSETFEQQLTQMQAQGIAPDTIDELRREAQTSAEHSIGSTFVLTSTNWLTLPVFGIVVLLVYPFYLKVIGMTLGATVTFRRWLALSVWARLPPTVLTLGVAAVCLPFVGSLPSPYLGGVLGLEFWIKESSGSFSISQVAVQLADIAWIWTSVLLTIGFKTWTGRSWMTAAVVVVAPSMALFIAIAFIFG